MALKQWKRIPAHKTPLRADVNQSVCCWRALCHAGARPWTESDGRARFFTALGKTPRCLQLSRPHVFSFFFFFWQIGCEAFTTDAHIAKIISAKLPLWPARGTWQAPFHASLYQTKYFQDNANYDKFHHPALCAFPLISLIRGNRGGSHGFSWGACCLIEWCWNRNPQPPLFLPSQLRPPRLFCPFIFCLSLLVWWVQEH